MSATIHEVDAYETGIAPRTLKDINWEQIAQDNCPDLYQTLYRLLSGDGTHTNITSIQRHLSFDVNQVISELKVGPDISDLVETLKAACLCFLWAAEPFVRIFDFEKKRNLSEFLQRFTELPKREPEQAHVTPNFQM